MIFRLECILLFYASIIRIKVSVTYACAGIAAATTLSLLSLTSSENLVFLCVPSKHVTYGKNKLFFYGHCL